MAVVEYDGTEYLGYQIQRIGKTVQGEIEKALQRVTQHRTRILGAGRTDAGVHAKGQVIHFAADWKHTLPDLQRALNALLPADIAVVELQEAMPRFHARYSARSREYVYTIHNGIIRSPLIARWAYHFPRPLDAEAMNQACACLVGEHDFLPFGWIPGGERDRPVTGRGTVRTVLRASCERQGDIVRVTIEADAFLRSMARRMVGNLLLVGAGELTAEQFKGLLQLTHRRLPGVAAPAHGLCLSKVKY
jgi:tRNA pseudouridine38-40 synthase